jgi:hypothetical protein
VFLPSPHQDTSFPLFDKVNAEHVVPGMRALLAQLHSEIDALEKSAVPTVGGGNDWVCSTAGRDWVLTAGRTLLSSVRPAEGRGQGLCAAASFMADREVHYRVLAWPFMGSEQHFVSLVWLV